tara:strand:+ start:5442 stop:6407 length:966 start_codon:yes stop_codon:yes gene_type:complete
MPSFLDNSGDIILDAVLTDTGRQRLARGDGSFTIAKYCFADDEINYGTYNSNLATARKDLEILQTPVLEAFTNSNTTVKHRLVTLAGQDTSLFLPVARLNTKSAQGAYPGFPYASTDNNGGDANQFVVVVNQTAVNKYVSDSSALTIQNQVWPEGFINGVSATDAAPYSIVVDQGLDTNQISYKTALTPDLIETEYLLSVDNRLLKVANPQGRPQQESFVDTNNIATYVLSSNTFYSQGASSGDAQSGDSLIAGPRGPRLQVALYGTTNVASSPFLFEQLGSTKSSYFPDSTNASIIDTVVRLQGNKTGISVDIPVRLVRA